MAESNILGIITHTVLSKILVFMSAKHKDTINHVAKMITLCFQLYVLAKYIQSNHLQTIGKT